MANEKNLIPLSERTKSEQREIAQKAGKASGASRRNKKMIRECLEILLEKRMKDEDGTIMTGAEAIALTAFQRALNGDMKAMEFVRDTAGQKPVEKIVTAEVEPSVIAEIEAAVFESNDEE